MKVIWALSAKLARVAIVQYLIDEFGRKSAIKFNKELKNVVAQVKNYPRSGQEEKFLAQRDEEYRSIPVGLYNKIVYRVLEKEIHVDDIWDTRREPKKQADNTGVDDVEIALTFK
jgi:plasmid stabilization system protein ParE